MFLFGPEIEGFTGLYSMCFAAVVELDSTFYDVAEFLTFLGQIYF